jgi:hypothetical protein
VLGSWLSIVNHKSAIENAVAGNTSRVNFNWSVVRRATKVNSPVLIVPGFCFVTGSRRETGPQETANPNIRGERL